MPEKEIVRRKNAHNYLESMGEQNLITQILEDIFHSRGAVYGEDNDYSLDKLLRPDGLKGIESAVDLLFDTLIAGKKILVVGDFDADGATSTALAVKCLRAFACKNVDFLVPNRFIFGYGLTPEIVEEAAKRDPELILTVDNGISSIEGVALAKKKGIRVIVTDHHLPSEQLPIADAIVNPNQGECPFFSKNLAGVGVIFYVMSALRKQLRDSAWFIKNAISEPNMASFLDLVALGTVADVVPLDFNNRILVSEGIRRIQAGFASTGIKALVKIARRETATLCAGDLGFALGPRINAAGRLDDMTLGIQCLLEENFQQALSLAKSLDDLNQDRKSIEASMQEEAVRILTALPEEVLLEQFGVCLYKKDWHQGVIGILASRIKDRLNRPTIVFADAENGELKGSGRSIPGLHLRDVLDEVASQNPGLIEKFGGHAMAAGMSINPLKFAAFKQEFDRVVSKHLGQKSPQSLIASDGELCEEVISLELAGKIRDIGPWGQHFPEPLFDGVFYIVRQRIVGNKHLKLIVSCEQYSDKVFDAIAFNIDLNCWPNHHADQVRMAYQLDINEYRGEVAVQLIVMELRVVEADSTTSA